MNDLLTGDSRNFRQIYELLSTTGLGGVGALMVIAGVMVATGTGVGIATAISTFVFGIPWITVGALVLPGALLVVMAAKKARPVPDGQPFFVYRSASVWLNCELSKSTERHVKSSD